ncbi:MAG TPA: acetyl-CoA C-acyltransferase, partial [Acidimicrobiales bacterium]
MSSPSASDAVIVAATRTPIGLRGKGLAGLTLQQLGEQTVAAAIAASGIDVNDIEDVVLGEVLQGGGCLARYVANALGLPPDTPGAAVQRQCATGMMAIQEVAANIRSGMIRAGVAGGVETMTRSPIMYQKAPLAFGVPQQFIPPSH